MSFNPFRKKGHREQGVLVATGDGRLVEATMTAAKGYMIDDALHEAFFMDHKALQREAGRNSSCIVLDERSAVPLYWGLPVNRAEREKSLESHMTQIASENLDVTLAAIPAKAQQDKMAAMIRTVALTFTICIVVFLIVGLVLSDSVSMPF